MAISVTTDVISYCVTKGSPVFACPDVSRCPLYYWYAHLTVQVWWNGKLNTPIRFLRGTSPWG